MPENSFIKLREISPAYILVSLILTLFIYYSSISCDENRVTETGIASISRSENTFHLHIEPATLNFISFNIEQLP